MTPSFRIIADRVDVTAAIKDRLLELAVIDVAGVESDEVKLTLDDRRREDGALAELPRIGTRLDVALGYAETALIGMGSYVVDEIEISSPPATLSVSAKAADMSGPMRSPKTRSWENLTLGDVVATIAREHRLVPATDPELASIPIVHIDQTAESDMAFLTRLASHYDAVAKPANGHWVFTKRGQAKSATGKKPADCGPQSARPHRVALPALGATTRRLWQIPRPGQCAACCRKRSQGLLLGLRHRRTQGGDRRQTALQRGAPRPCLEREGACCRAVSAIGR